jgi:hypothetical protein
MLWEGPMKTCTRCRKHLGLGVRYRWVWRNFWFTTTRFCSAQCERLYDQEREDLKRYLAFHARGSPR